jgi:hypothetical protein
MPVPFPGLPPLPGQTTEVERPGPKFVAAKSSKRSPAPAVAKADLTKVQPTETQAMHDVSVAPEGYLESGQELHIVQPAALEASDAEQSEVRLVVTELIDEDAAALATYESTPAEPEHSVNDEPMHVMTSSPRPAPSALRARPLVPGFVR